MNFTNKNQASGQPSIRVNKDAHLSPPSPSVTAPESKKSLPSMVRLLSNSAKNSSPDFGAKSR